jgi:hypothetical protein
MALDEREGGSTKGWIRNKQLQHEWREWGGGGGGEGITLEADEIN